MGGATTHRLGAAEVHIEQDLVYVHTRGRLRVEDVQRLERLIIQVCEQHGRYFLLVNLHEVDALPPSVRRQLVAMSSQRPAAAGAFYGGNLAQRAINSMVLSAARLLSRGRQNVSRFATEEQARVWLAAERLRLTG